MNHKILLKTVKREVRRTLGPTGLLGRRGPAKNIEVLVVREVERQLRSKSRVIAATVLPERFLEVGSSQ